MAQHLSQTLGKPWYVVRSWRGRTRPAWYWTRSRFRRRMLKLPISLPVVAKTSVRCSFGPPGATQGRRARARTAKVHSGMGELQSRHARERLLTDSPPCCDAPAIPGARVLGIAFGEAECHKKLLAVGLPGVDMGEDDGHEFAGQEQGEVGACVDSQLALGHR
jgi:hypothetical protein